jgi:RNA polymerase sigma factor (TIGR02999 family)
MTATDSMEKTPHKASDDDAALAGLTQALSEAGNGDENAPERLLPMVYAELRRLAASKMSGEPAHQTLQPTALVHEAWLRIAASKDIVWHGRNHFFSVAAEAMRRILIERARRRSAAKRGGGWERLDLDHVDVASETQTDTLLAVDEALAKLMQVDRPCGELVKLRFFGGLTLDEAGDVLGISGRTAKRYWSFARVWLYNEILRQEGGTP